jgi:dipeptidyl-peptidase-4
MLRRIPLLVALLLAVAARAQSPLSPEWIYSAAGRAVTQVPQYTWLEDGSLLLLDSTRPPEARTFERVDPSTGERRPALDTPRATASLAEAGPGSRTLGWPDAIDRRGARLFYLFDGDVFAIDTAASRATRLTRSAEEERNLTVSPDGRRVAFVRGRNLYTVDVAGGRETQLTHDGSETTLNGTLSWVYWEEIFGRRDMAYWWSPDSRRIAYLQTDESPVAVSHFLDFRPATARLTAQRYPKAGGRNPIVRTGVVDAGGGRTRWISIAEPFEWILRVGWLPDSARVSVQTLSRDQQRLGLYFADAANGRAQRVLEETDPGWVNVSDDLRFLRGSREFLWSSERTGYRHLYRYRIDGTLAGPVTSGEWALASADQSVYWVTRALAGVDEDGGWAYFGSLNGSSIERQLWRARLDGTGIERITRERGTHNVSMAPDARHYVDARSDIRTPPSVSLRRADGTLVAELSAPRTEAIASLGLRYPELTTIPVSDGFPLPAQILKPAAMPVSGRRTRPSTRSCSRAKATRWCRSTTARPPGSASGSRTRS